jgi:hypothetical protein
MRPAKDCVCMFSFGCCCPCMWRMLCVRYGARVCVRRIRCWVPGNNFEMKAQPALAMSQVLLQQWHAPGT